MRILHYIKGVFSNVFRDILLLVISIVSIYILIFLYLPIILSISTIFFSRQISIDVVTTSLPILLRSFEVALVSTFLTVIIAIPISYSISFYLGSVEKAIVSILIIAPYWVGTLLKTYSLAYLIYVVENLLNVRILYTETSIYLGIIYNYTPMAIIPILLAMDRIDRIYVDTARVIGAKGVNLVFRVILPMSSPGLLSSFVLVFTGSLGELVIPQVLGGSPRYMIGQWVYELAFFYKRFAEASVISLIYLLTTLVMIGVVSRGIGSRRVML